MKNTKLIIEIDKRKQRFEDYLQPPGFNQYRRYNGLSIAWSTFLLFLFSFVVELIRARNEFSQEIEVYKNLTPDYLYSELIEQTFIILVVGIVFCLFSVSACYRYLKIDGSNGLERLKRLPDRTEWFRRVWGLPLVSSGILFVVLIIAYFAGPHIFRTVAYWAI